MKFYIVGFALLAATACAQLTPSGEYLPPGIETAVAPAHDYLAPAEGGETIFGDDGYRYKAIRRLRTQRKRRDVSELSDEYLPPQHEEIAYAPAEEEQTILADDGYRYKAVHRLRTQRKRRDVNELPSAEYLPPQNELTYAAPSNEYLSPAVAPAEEHTLLADDGYRYKAIRRLRTQRKRRDVSELPTAEYLPPQNELAIAAPSNEYLAPAAAEEETVLADDGYRYKAVRRLRTQRKRRDVSELPSAEYLPPHHEELATVPSEEEHTVLADDGYRYKTVHRLRSQRKRRDVNELPSSEYLPPQHHHHHHEEINYAPSNEYLAPAVEPHTILADDGYRYKSVRKLKFRRH